MVSGPRTLSVIVFRQAHAVESIAQIGRRPPVVVGRVGLAGQPALIVVRKRGGQRQGVGEPAHSRVLQRPRGRELLAVGAGLGEVCVPYVYISVKVVSQVGNVLGL